MINKLKVIWISVGCSLLLSGCLNFKYHQQIHMLKKEGFEFTQEGWSFGLPAPLLFDFDRARISSESIQQINDLSIRLKEYDLTHLKIIGYTDNVGTEEYNLKLSQQRANYVGNIFIKNGFSKNNLVIMGKGSAQPILPNSTANNRANNRRVTVIVMP